MKQLAWLLLIAALAGIVYSLWRLRRVWRQRREASEERYATLLASTLPKPAASPTPNPVSDPGALSQQKLLLEAASKAGEAGEAALSIQLYARLLARYPESSFAGQARAAVEVQKRKFASARAPGTAGPG